VPEVVPEREAVLEEERALVRVRGEVAAGRREPREDRRDRRGRGCRQQRFAGEWMPPVHEVRLPLGQRYKRHCPRRRGARGGEERGPAQAGRAVRRKPEDARDPDAEAYRGLERLEGDPGRQPAVEGDAVRAEGDGDRRARDPHISGRERNEAGDVERGEDKERGDERAVDSDRGADGRRPGEAAEDGERDPAGEPEAQGWMLGQRPERVEDVCVALAGAPGERDAGG